MNVISSETHLASYKISKTMTDDYVFKPINYFNDDILHKYYLSQLITHNNIILGLPIY